MRPILSPALMIAGSLMASSALAEGKPELIVYAPDYFASEWGPGPQIEKGFEGRCGCDLQFRTGDLLTRLRLEGDTTPADVVIGLTTDQTAAARATGLLADHGKDLSTLTLPIAWTDPVFVPFNWGEAAFIYDKNRLATPPASFAAFLTAPDDLKIVIQDPRSSPSGLALLLWVKAVYGDTSGDAWRALKPKVLTVTPGWSEAYGLFTSGEADMVLSYITSPAYHIIAEHDLTKAALIFPEGHYFTAELVAKTGTTDQPALADAFLDYVLSDDFQGMIATANWSYPARMTEGGLPPEFAALARPEKTLFLTETEAEMIRGPVIDEWLSIMSE
ncbi:thiamine ABC transporter substrate binding subunit [Frigidibacter sp. RF13]|uniref:thiamine ABC transporter substrate-binding protein n=1 Tax=Frigidibacter sp. RF13 TaxID=2997340 RepID=UPI00226EB4AE|nr:thiamine ABC transporter substrate binding subunit [Frigidibacter sp. RF13]MCY1128256.1 thiamine ABC transporter substrate binding subunit [Frigidibacter sp. RF13]